MCNRYRLPTPEHLVRDFDLLPDARYAQQDVFPRGRGYFIRRAQNQAAITRELVAGQWALIPWFATSAQLRYSTNNARSEEITTKASFKLAWSRGQRCIIPAEIFWEPCWETGRNVWWTFRRTDERSFGLAGLWNGWMDRHSGEVIESYTLLTINADRHPLMRRMHKPDPKLPTDQQDKRMVVVLEPQLWDEWLFAPLAAAHRLMTTAPVGTFLPQPQDADNLSLLMSTTARPTP